MNRSVDWLRQAKRDLEQARWAAQGEFHELACFLSQQAGEKALKALCQGLNVLSWGHSIVGLVGDLPAEISVPGDVVAAAKSLDRHYIPARYPNAFASGVPADYYTAAEAEEAVRHAEQIVAFCEQHLPG